MLGKMDGKYINRYLWELAFSVVPYILHAFIYLQCFLKMNMSGFYNPKDI